MYIFPTIIIASILVLLYSIVLQHHCPPAYVTDARTNVSYQGISSDGVDSFLNIHYGQDTGGAGRFAPPKPFIPSQNSVINATINGAACPQQPVPFPGINGLLDNVTNISEDCLTLRIARPASISQHAKLPVMVYIYGGGYSIGQAYDNLYQPDRLILNSVKSGTPVIYVAMNYRLGIFGFATSDLLRERRSANAGLRDQRLALEWVKENIGVFGGDPERVTVFGESAGGMSIALQMSAFGGKQSPPFQQAILESGNIFPLVASGYDDQHLDDAVTISGCNYRNPDSEASLECLRSLTWNELLETSLTVGATESPFVDGLLAFLPSVDGDFIPAAPSTLFETGQFSKVPTIIGWNHDDGSLFVDPTIKTEEDTFAFLLKSLPGITVPTLDKILSLYHSWEFDAEPAINASAQFLRTSRITRDIFFTCSGLLVATEISSPPKHETPHPSIYHSETTAQTTFLQRIFSFGSSSKGHHHHKAPPVFIYELNQTSLNELLSAQGFPFLGVSHIADVPYVFDEVFKFDNSASNQLLAQHMSGSWTRFATSGTPSSPRGTTLRGWTEAFGRKDGYEHRDNLKLMVIGGGNPGMTGLTGKNIEIAKERLVERCVFINSEEVQREIGE